MPGFFSNTLAVLRREIYRVARQPMYWLLTVILPIVAFAFFAVLLYKGVARDIPIAVVDQDNSTLSRKVTQMIDATPTAWVAYGVQGMEEAERLMLQGKVMGIVLIPDFFEKNILNNSQTHLESYLTGTNITVNGLLAKDLQTTVTTFTAGIQLQLLMKQGLTEKQAMAQLMPVRFDKHVLFNPHINYGYYLSPSFMPMMLLIFTIMATIFVIGTELKNGTAREWYDTAGGSVFAAYAGKILPITVIMFLMSELMLLVIFKVVGVPLNGSLTVITISNLLFILSYQSLVSGIGTTGAMVEFQRLIAKGANIPQATATTQPVIYQSHNLFNPYLGYGSFVMPAIIMVIIQQTMLIGIGMIGGTWSEFGLYKKLIPPGRRRMSTLPVVAGKAFVYASIYAVTLFYILGLHYKLFHFPTNGHTADIIAFLIPYLLSCIFLGIAVSTLFQRREQSIMLLLWCSIPALMLSGASVPREAMPEWLYLFGQILPSSSGVEGFIRIQSMGASFSDVLHEVRILWILTIVYGGFAAVGIHLRLKQAAGK